MNFSVEELEFYKFNDDGVTPPDKNGQWVVWKDDTLFLCDSDCPSYQHGFMVKNVINEDDLLKILEAINFNPVRTS